MAASRNRTPPEAALHEAVAAVLAAAVGPGERVCVAFSGGVDSMTLLHALAALRGRFGFALAAAHVHHGLSPNADAWSAFCARQCAALSVPLRVFAVEVERDHPSGLEAAARSARHDALAGLDCDWLAFGHHCDDQAETLLFRLLRGAGVRGAAAMAAVEPGTPGRLRPLLGLRRAELVACARAASLAWIDDESNDDPRYARNFLRHHVLPVVEQAFPAAAVTLARAAEQFREADVLLSELAVLDEAACGGAVLSRERLLALSEPRQRNVLRWRLQRLGAQAPARARLVEAVRQLRGASGGPLRLALGSAFCCAYRDDVWLERADDAQVPLRPVAWHGEPALRWGGGAVRLEASRGAGIARGRLRQARSVELATRWIGLTMREGPGRPRRSFKNLCQEAAIPAWLRERLPVLRVDGEAAWIGGIGVAAEFACGDAEEGLVPVWRRGGSGEETGAG